ncbi:MAG: serine hydrolase domain-containing protein [Pseudomonadota bacterium]
MQFLLALVLGLMALQGTAHAGIPARVEAAFDAWLAENKVDGGVLVLLSKGEPIAEVERGIGADVPVELASVGKSITALCIASLVEDGVLTYDAPLTRYLGADAPEATIAQLLTHTAGLTVDSTQFRMPRWLGNPAPRHEEVTALVLARRNDPPGTHSYNNENYALLGTIIARATGESYARTCTEKVTDRLGLTSARLSPLTGAFGPWGGWQMSARDYATLHWAVYSGRVLLDADPFSYPHAETGYGAFYGLGTVFRPTGGSQNFWHFGALCFRGGPNVGTFAVSWKAEFTLFAFYRACIDVEAMIALDNALAQAVLAAEPAQ